MQIKVDHIIVSHLMTKREVVSKGSDGLLVVQIRKLKATTFPCGFVYIEYSASLPIVCLW